MSLFLLAFISFPAVNGLSHWLACHLLLTWLQCPLLLLLQSLGMKAVEALLDPARLNRPVSTVKMGNQDHRAQEGKEGIWFQVSQSEFDPGTQVEGGKNRFLKVVL